MPDDEASRADGQNAGAQAERVGGDREGDCAVARVPFRFLGGGVFGPDLPSLAVYQLRVFKVQRPAMPIYTNFLTPSMYISVTSKSSRLLSLATSLIEDVIASSLYILSTPNS